MSVSLLEVINAAGYDIETYEDAQWLLAQRQQFEGLVETAEDAIEAHDQAESEESEREYRERFGDE